MADDDIPTPLGMARGLATFVGIFAGALRAKGVVEVAELEQIFSLADEIFEKEDNLLAAQMLGVVRAGARAVM